LLEGLLVKSCALAEQKSPAQLAGWRGAKKGPNATMTNITCPTGSAQQARDQRRECEAALEARRWPWSRRLSLWLDALLVLEEAR
jgi:hypothetical protein